MAAGLKIQGGDLLDVRPILRTLWKDYMYSTVLYSFGTIVLSPLTVRYRVGHLMYSTVGGQCMGMFSKEENNDNRQFIAHKKRKTSKLPIVI